VNAPWRPATARLGAVGRPHALDGSFRVDGAVDWHPYASGSRILVGGVERRIVARSGDDLRPILRLAGIDSRTAIEALRGASLEVPTDQVPEPEEDAFWVFDLIGCTVELEGRVIGTIREVLERPANDVLVADALGGGDDLLVPFTRDAVPEVDIPGRRISIRPDLL
jgi:16S rRNA processing protein RimM